MRATTSTWLFLMVFSAVGGASAATSSVDLDEDEAPAGSSAPAGEEGEDFTQKTDAEDDLNQSDAAEPAPAEDDWDKDALQIYVGLQDRLIIVPQFLINAFGVAGGTTLVTNGIGPEIGFSKRDYEIRLSPWFAAYHTGDMPFKGPNDGEDAWEIVNSQLNAIFITADFILKKEVATGWDWTIGASGGVGLVFGNLYRTEAYWAAPYSPLNPGNPNTDLRMCTSPGVPNPAECDNPGDYGLANAWPVYPWLSFQTGVRYQPTRHFIARLDLGAGSSGFWLGLGADYGL